MRIPIIISICFHVAVILVAWLGLPHLSNDNFEMPTRSIAVEVVSEEDIIKEVAQVETPPPPPPTPPPPPPPPPPKPVEPKVEAPAPEPEPTPEPEAEPVPVEPKKVVKPPKVEKPEPKPVAPKPSQLAETPRPKSKPKEPPKHDMASVLKTVAKLDDVPVEKKIEKKVEVKEKDKISLADAVAKALETKQIKKQTLTLDGSLSMSEMDVVKRQITGCWNIQPGARDAENLLVKLKVLMNSDMTVRSVQIIDTGESANPFWQAAADGAMRAVLKCSPLNLPVGKYNMWKVINFTFDPKQMFG